MTLKVIHRLQAFSNAIRRTFVQHFTRFQLTVCSRASSALAELLVYICAALSTGLLSAFDGVCRSKYMFMSKIIKLIVTLVLTVEIEAWSTLQVALSCTMLLTLRSTSDITACVAQKHATTWPYQRSYLDSRLAYPRPRPRLRGSRPRPRLVKTGLETSRDQDSSLENSKSVKDCSWCGADPPRREVTITSVICNQLSTRTFYSNHIG